MNKKFNYAAGVGVKTDVLKQYFLFHIVSKRTCFEKKKTILRSITNVKGQLNSIHPTDDNIHFE